MQASVLLDGEGKTISAGGLSVQYKVTSDRTGDQLPVLEAGRRPDNDAVALYEAGENLDAIRVRVTD